MILCLVMSFQVKHQKHDPWKKNLISWILLRSKSSALQKTLLKEWKDKTTNWGKVSEKHVSEKGLIDKIYKEILKLNNKKKKKPNEIYGEKIWMGTSPGNIQMANKNMKRCSKSYVIRKCKLKQQRDNTTRLSEWLTQKTKMTIPGLPWWRSGWESACQCRGHGFEPWSGRIPHATEQLGPWATTTEPARLEPVLRNKRGHDNERPAHRDEEWPPLAAAGESPHTETDPTQP